MTITLGDRRPVTAQHPARTVLIDIVAPVAGYYGIRGVGGGIWLALVISSALPAVSAIGGLLGGRRRLGSGGRPGSGGRAGSEGRAGSGRRLDATGLVMVGALAASTALSLISGSPRALLVRDGLVTAGWAGYLYLSLLARRPVTFTISRALLEGRRVYNPAARAWQKPAGASWDDLWLRLPRFRHIWRVCTMIWGTAILADAVIRIVTAWALPLNEVPGINAALWPVTFIMLQVATNIYFARSGFWRILLRGAE